MLFATSTEFERGFTSARADRGAPSDGRYATGPGIAFTGYMIEADDTAGSLAGSRASQPDLGALWDF